MKLPMNPAFKPLQYSNSIAQCRECKTVSTYDTLDVLISSDRTCRCGGKLKFFWSNLSEPISFLSRSKVT